MSATKAPPGWYPEPGHEDSLRYWDGQEWTEQRTGAGLSRPPDQFGAFGRVIVFVVMSVPLLAGFFFWGSAVLLAWMVIPLAAAFGPHIWPNLRPGGAAFVAAVVAGLVWLPAFGVQKNLIIALCGPDLRATVVPAAAASAAYLLLGLASALKRWVSLWVAAAVIVPVVHAVVTRSLDAPITC